MNYKPRIKTVAVCNDCWKKEKGDRRPYRLNDEDRQEEECFYCEKPTRSGIYVREMVYLNEPNDPRV